MTQKVLKLFESPIRASGSLFILNFIEKPIERDSFVNIDNLNNFYFSDSLLFCLFSYLFGQKYIIYLSISMHIDVLIDIQQRLVYSRLVNPLSDNWSTFYASTQFPGLCQVFR
jgi:hypothetical protein